MKPLTMLRNKFSKSITLRGAGIFGGDILFVDLFLSIVRGFILVSTALSKYLGGMRNLLDQNQVSGMSRSKYKKIVSFSLWIQI